MQSKTKILMVDDNKEFCEIIKEYLGMQSDMEVTGVAYDGKTAMEMIAQSNPDIVLLDIVMPKIDGLDILDRYNSSSIKSKPVFIIMSALGRGWYTQKALERGAACYISKPMDLEVLAKMIRDYIPASRKSEN